MTGTALGAALNGMKAIVVHPRMDFMVLASDQLVNQAAKWSHMFGGQDHPGVTIRSIINRGGEQGAQHSQALHAWFAHVPGLRVVMPSTVADARDLLIASVLCKDPVIYIDDRWLYDEEELVKNDLELINLKEVKPNFIDKGDQITLVGIGHSTKLIKEATKIVENVSAEIIDLRLLNPINYSVIIDSVKKTGRLIVVDSDWSSCGMASEIISSVCEQIHPNNLKSKPIKLTLTDAPAPTSKPLEDIYYITPTQVANCILKSINEKNS